MYTLVVNVYYGNFVKFVSPNIIPYVCLHVESRCDASDRGRAIIDIFRLENRKIAEHWDVSLVRRLRSLFDKLGNHTGFL